jgi:Methylase of chemotaxis methyl-accepting proteins
VNDTLNARDYGKLAVLLERQVGIRLPPGKQTMVEGRLRRRARSLNLSGLDEYCHRIFRQGELSGEMDSLIDALTTNKTDFYREPTHFEFLQREGVPSLLADRTARHLKVWSAACSNGAEPYTLAMVLADLSAQLRFQFIVLGTDICTEVLEEAVRAIYPAQMMEPVPADVAARYLMWSRGRKRTLARIAPELRRTVRFARLNLMDSSYPLDRDVDIIFCRNVLIYFSPENQQAVIERLSRHLRPGGYLVLGHSDCLTADAVSGMRQAAVTVLQRE